MKIKISGTGEAVIEIKTDSPASSVNSMRDAALLAEALYWNLSQDSLMRFMTYLAKKVTEVEADKRIIDIIKKGNAAVSVVYPTGDRTIMSEKDAAEILDKLQEEYDSLDENNNEDDEDENDYGIPDE
jgi:hypothetical protein